MTPTRTQLVAVLARNALVVLLITLLCRSAIASTDPPSSTAPARPASSDPANSTDAARKAATDLPDAPNPSDGQPTELHITILEGEGALNNIRQRTAREPIIQVEDQNHKPVAGVLILFSIHSGAGGAGASFNGLSTLSVKTGLNGQAAGHGFVPNAHPGNFTINVSATHGNLSDSTVIHQQNISGTGKSNSQNGQSAPPPVNHHSALKWGIVGGVIIGVTIILLLDRSSGANISLGGGTVGHP